MDKKKRELLCLLKRMDSIVDRQFSCQTVATYLEHGWDKSEFVFEEGLLPLLARCESIALIGYKSSWKEHFDSKLLPDWAELFDRLVFKEGRRYFLAPELDAMRRLFEYWQKPYIMEKSTTSFGMKTIRPAKPIIEIKVSNVDVSYLKKASKFFFNVSNPWAGGFESAGKYVRQKIKENNSIYLVYRDLSSFSFFGSDDAIAELVDSVIYEGRLMDEIEDHCPGWWEDAFDCQENESVEDAAERIFREELS